MDIADFRKRGWLQVDGLDSEGGPLFHCFRFYVLHRILGTRELDPSWGDAFARRVDENMGRWNEIVDLAILLEPPYWPPIVGRTPIGHCSEEEYLARVEGYRDRTKDWINALDKETWQKRH